MNSLIQLLAEYENIKGRNKLSNLISNKKTVFYYIDIFR